MQNSEASLVIQQAFSKVLPGKLDIIQLVHSFEVNIRICQPGNSDVHQGKAEVNISFEG